MQHSSQGRALEPKHPLTIKASAQGKLRIKQSRENKGWKYNADDDDTPLKEATRLLEPVHYDKWEEQWKQGERIYAVSSSTWKRFQNARDSDRIKAEFFKVFCQILDLSWTEIAEINEFQVPVIGDLPDLEPFYGRTWYLNRLQDWIVQDHSRLVFIYGQPGIGKTSLIRQFIEKARTEFSSEFNELIWLTASTFFPDLFPDQPEEASNSIAVLFELLKRQGSLIVLDRWTEVLGVHEGVAEYLGESLDSARLLQKLFKQEHHNSVILISDEKPLLPASQTTLLKSMRLEGFGKIRPGFCELDEDKKILQAEGLKGEESELNAFLTRYSNPSVLKSVAARAREVFGGNVTRFVECKFSIFLDADFGERLDRVWTVLSKEERMVMYCLAIRRESRSFEQLADDIVNFGIRSDELIELLYCLIGKQSLIELNENLEYSLGLVWQKFSTRKLIQESSEEIFRAIERDRIQNTELFLRLAFVTSTTQDKRLETEQMRRIVIPILNDLIAKRQDRKSLHKGLEHILASLKKYSNVGAYGIQNIEALLSTLSAW